MNRRAVICGQVFGALLVVGGIPAAPAQAQSKLPWADANPLERDGSKPRKRKPVERARPKAAEARAETPAISDVPVPDERPLQAGEGEASPKPSPGSDGPEGNAPATAAGTTAPGDDAGATLAAPEATKSSVRDVEESVQKPADVSGAEDEASTGAAAPAPVDPAAIAQKPISEIPVPVDRPEDGGSTTGPTAPEARPAEPVPEDAPNATEKLKARQLTVTPEETVRAAAVVQEVMLCESELRKRGVTFTVEPTISEGECGVLRPMKLSALSSGVKVSPDTQFLCWTALALDDWMTGSVVPAAKRAFPEDKLTEFRHASTYVCRPRASEKGVSEHARGSAIDIAAFVFADGKTIGVEAQTAGSKEAEFQGAIRVGACGPFKTVLGPGTDGDHATHFHLDMAARRNGATYCR